MNGRALLRFSSVSIILLFLTSGSIVFKISAQISVDEAASALANAELRVLSAYQSVLEAEEAGANASGLLARLNEAADFLARGRMAYSLKDFEEATQFANLGMIVGEEVEDAVVEIRDIALMEGTQHLVYTTIASVAAIASIALGSTLVWHRLRKRYACYRSWLIAGSLGLILVAAAPTSALFIRLPSSSERFSELWLLGQGHKAEDYPFNVRVNGTTYSVYVGVGNQLGYSAYYRVDVKFRNHTQPLPDSANSTPSPLNSTYEFQFFLENNKQWEAPLTFAFQGEPKFVTNILIDDFVFPVNRSSTLISMHATDKGYYYQLFFELWLYNMTSQAFQYHNRFVAIWLNMTS